YLFVSGTNTTYLSNAVNNYFGCNFKRLINSYRVVRAKELLDGKDCPVNELFSRCGFASKSVFYVAFRKVVGMTPLQYISQSRNPFMIQRN
ncbi:helix-turn-helix domain-containing protein, partial [Phocaeicola vulgatus]